MTAISIYLILAAGLLVALVLLAVASVVGRAIARRIHHHPSCQERTPHV